MKRKLGLFDSVILGLCGAIGFEIFVLMDYAYFNLANSGVIWSVLLGGLINVLIMFSYCELSSAIPEVGGEYTYIKVVYGGLIAFISGCFRWLASVVGAALAALAFANQLLYLISKVVPAISGFISTKIPLIAIILITILAALEIMGVKKIGTMIVILFLAIFALFLLSGVRYGLPPSKVILTPLPEGLTGVFAATAYIFPMFFGMRAVVANADLIKNPERNVPIGILLSGLLVIPLYVSISYVAVGVISSGDVGSPLLNYTAEKIMGAPGGILFSIAGIVACISACRVSISVQSGIARGMSRDGYLPKIMLSVHRRFETHYIAVIVGSLFVIFLSAIGVMEFLGYAASFGSILVFAIVNLTLMKLRKKRPYLKRPFKAPLYPITPAVGFVMSIVLIAFPLFMGDMNAVSALTYGLGLGALALIAYYLRMVGRYRLRVAIGGVSLGIGIFTALFAYMLESGLIQSVILSIPFQVFIFVSVVFVAAGLLNIAASTRKVF